MECTTPGGWGQEYEEGSLGATYLGLKDQRAKRGSLVVPGIHNSMIFRANKECPYKSSWIL
jgi:hypothetical protein